MKRHAANDLHVKPAEYLRRASLEADIVANQDEPSCKLWVRGTITFLTPKTISGMVNSLAIPALSLAIPLAEIYGGLFAGI